MMIPQWATRYEVIDTHTGSVKYKGVSYWDALQYACAFARDYPSELERIGVLVHRDGLIMRYIVGKELRDICTREG